MSLIVLSNQPMEAEEDYAFNILLLDGSNTPVDADASKTPTIKVFKADGGSIVTEGNFVKRVGEAGSYFFPFKVDFGRFGRGKLFYFIASAVVATVTISSGEMLRVADKSLLEYIYQRQIELEG